MKSLGWLKYSRKGLGVLFVLTMIAGICFAVGGEPEKEEIVSDKIRFLPNTSVFANVKEVSLELETLVADLSTKKGTIYIRGYVAKTDNDGANARMAKERAEAVKKELIKQAGGERSFESPVIVVDPLEYNVFGLPWGDNFSEQTRAPNRRAIISFIPDAPVVEITEIIEAPPVEIQAAAAPTTGTAPVEAPKAEKSFPWLTCLLVLAILILLALILALVLLFSLLSKLKSGAWVTPAVVEPIPPAPLMETKAVVKEKYYDERNDIPPEAKEMLKRMGLPKAEIDKLAKKHGGIGEREAPATLNKGWRKYLDEQIDYLQTGCLKDRDESPHEDLRALGRLTANSPLRQQSLENFRLMRKGEKKVAYHYGKFIKNMEDFGYYKTDVYATLGVDVYPGQKNRALGYLRLASLSAAIEQGDLTDENDIQRAKQLAPRIFNRPAHYTPADERDFKAILDKVPDYTGNYVTWHEQEDGRTFVLVAEGKLHTSRGTGGLYHVGGTVLVEDAEKLLKSR
jgi:hypothetical protein